MNFMRFMIFTKITATVQALELMRKLWEIRTFKDKTHNRNVIRAELGRLNDN